MSKLFAFVYDPEGHRSPGFNLAVGTVEPGGTYEVDYPTALGLRHDPDFRELVSRDAPAAEIVEAPKPADAAAVKAAAKDEPAKAARK